MAPGASRAIPAGPASASFPSAPPRFTDMRETFDDALVTGWEELEAGIFLPDSDDRHVVAAAIRADAQAIVTSNVGDFSGETLSPFELGRQCTQMTSCSINSTSARPPSCR